MAVVHQYWVLHMHAAHLHSYECCPCSTLGIATGLSESLHSSWAARDHVTGFELSGCGASGADSCQFQVLLFWTQAAQPGFTTEQLQQMPFEERF
jgi:hypothetical protein